MTLRTGAKQSAAKVPPSASEPPWTSPSSTVRVNVMSIMVHLCSDVERVATLFQTIPAFRDTCSLSPMSELVVVRRLGALLEAYRLRLSCSLSWQRRYSFGI